MTIYLAMGNSLLVVSKRDGRWDAETKLDGLPTQCVAADPARPERVYCGTFGQGLWRSDDAGRSWQGVSDVRQHPQVMAVAVSRLEQAGGFGVVWVGTEPSALFRSDDGGQVWLERPTLKSLPSAPTWSFPPRPYTSHVRWIQLDPNRAEELFVAIELGGVMRSVDDGLIWEDRTPTGPLDAHTLRMHPLAPGRIYAAAGDGFSRPGMGFAESFDNGKTWIRPNAGITRDYLWGLAVDPGNPDAIVVSGAASPRQAHDPDVAESAIYRRIDATTWEQVTIGLPEPRGTVIPVLATNPDEPGVFYAACNHGLFRSHDDGVAWERIDVPWPTAREAAHVNGLVITSYP